MPPWDALSLMDKGRKTHALLCLATGWRPGADFHKTLASAIFDIRDGCDIPEGLILTAIDVKEGGNKESLPIPRLAEDEDMCPVLHTWKYLRDTKELRNNTSVYLFISATPPHGHLSADRLRNWLKSIMTEAGIKDTPHSIRAVTTSTAWDTGVPIEEILVAGNWTSETTFERFYHLR